MKYLLLTCSVVPLLFLGACASDKKTNEEVPTKELYQQAESALQEKQYNKASDLFEEVERLYPYSPYATESQLKAAYSQYENNDYEEAILSLDRFIELHPGHSQIDYAYYLKALCYYEQIADIHRDQSVTRNALDSFNALIRRFPASKYTQDATLKRDLTLDHLAGKEMEIGRYYLKQNQVNAAINRFLIVVRNFQTTSHVPEALHRLVEAYLTLGLKGEATKVAAVLGHNYPGSEWYEASYKLLDPAERESLINDRSFLDKSVDMLLKRGDAPQDTGTTEIEE
jgi:outer membrane protein assembly factor BamD